MGTRDLLFVGLVAGGMLALGSSLVPRGLSGRTADPGGRAPSVLSRPPAADAVDRAFRAHWAEAGLRPAPRATDLAVLRRMTLALTGTVPSLQEIRQFEAKPGPDRLSRALERLMADRRFADYFAERLARVYVGTEDGPFIVFRRRRLVSWLSDELYRNRPYDQLVRSLIEGKGLWTDNPATNFITATFEEERKAPNPERLGARVARAFLGVRIDCAQCHDHPFQAWKQSDFQGLSAFFGQTFSGLTGLRDGAGEYRAKDRKTGAELAVAPRVPFRPELLPADGTRRERLARWLTDPRNPSLARATVNRVWALMFGRPLVEPVDDLTAAEDGPRVLELLADDFAANGFDLRRLIRTIAAIEAFRLDSAADPEPTEELERSWAAFPLTRLRPEQVVGGILQAASVQTIDRDSHILVRIIRAAGENDFVVRYGDTGEDEFNAGCGTIPQRLLMMNGKIVTERLKDGLFNATEQIAGMAPDDGAAVDAAFLTVLTRRPSPEESAYFRKKLEGLKGKERARRMTDLFWTLLNSTEFSWDH